MGGGNIALCKTLTFRLGQHAFQDAPCHVVRLHLGLQHTQRFQRRFVAARHQVVPNEFHRQLGDKHVQLRVMLVPHRGVAPLRPDPRQLAGLFRRFAAVGSPRRGEPHDFRVFRQDAPQVLDDFVAHVLPHRQDLVRDPARFHVVVVLHRDVGPRGDAPGPEDRFGAFHQHLHLELVQRNHCLNVRRPLAPGETVFSVVQKAHHPLLVDLVAELDKIIAASVDRERRNHHRKLIIQIVEERRSQLLILPSPGQPRHIIV